jgi:hypothetical protein
MLIIIILGFLLIGLTALICKVFDKSIRAYLILWGCIKY